MSAPRPRALDPDAAELALQLRGWVVGAEPGSSRANQVAAPGEGGTNGGVLPGELEPLDALVGELQGIAARIMNHQPPGHTLQATALLNEFWLRISSREPGKFADRNHFLGVAVTTMRRIVVDHARRKRAGKRPESGQRLDLEHVAGALQQRSELDLVELDDLLEALGADDPDLLRVIELRFFGGCGVEEAAQVLGWSTRRLRSEELLARKRLERLMR